METALSLALFWGTSMYITFTLMERLMKKGYFLQEARLYSQLERNRCSITSRGEFLFVLLGRKGRDFVIWSTGRRDVMSLKERSNLPPYVSAILPLRGRWELRLAQKIATCQQGQSLPRPTPWAHCPWGIPVPIASGRPSTSTTKAWATAAAVSVLYI